MSQSSSSSMDSDELIAECISLQAAAKLDSLKSRTQIPVMTESSSRKPQPLPIYKRTRAAVSGNTNPYARRKTCASKRKWTKGEVQEISDSDSEGEKTKTDEDIAPKSRTTEVKSKEPSETSKKSVEKPRRRKFKTSRKGVISESGSRKFMYKSLMDDSRFISQTAQKNFETLHYKEVFAERKVVFGKFKDIEIEVMNLLKNVGLESILDYPGSFSESLVREFYSNLTEEVFKEGSSYYGRVFLRGKTYDFNAVLIENFLQCCSVITESYYEELDLDLVASEITGTDFKWNKKGLKASDLTSKYSILHRISKSNWTPTKQNSVLNQDIASFIFRIGTSSGVSFGEYVFKAIWNFCSNYKTVLLPYACIICGVIMSQSNSVITEKEFMNGALAPITFQAKTTKPKPSKPDSEAQEPSQSSASIGKSSTVELLRRLVELNKQEEAIRIEKAEINKLLEKSRSYTFVKGAPTIGESDKELTETSSEDVSFYEPELEVSGNEESVETVKGKGKEKMGEIVSDAAAERVNIELKEWLKEASLVVEKGVEKAQGSANAEVRLKEAIDDVEKRLKEANSKVVSRLKEAKESCGEGLSEKEELDNVVANIGVSSDEGTASGASGDM